MASSNSVLIKDAVAAADLSSYQYYACYLNASGWNLCATQGKAGVIGILTNDPTSGEVASVMILGLAKAKLGGTVSAGDPLCVTSAGKLVKADEDTEFVIGYATEAGVLNDIRQVFLCQAGMVPGTEDTEVLAAAANYSVTGQYLAMKINNAGKWVKCAVAGEVAQGVLQNAPAADADAQVKTHGEATFYTVNGVTRGDALATSATGSLETATAGQAVLGYALETVGATSTGLMHVEVGGLYSVDGVALADGKIWAGSAAGKAAAVTPSGDLTMSNAGAFTVTDVTLGSDAAGDLHQKTSATVTARLPIGAMGKKLTSTGSLSTWDRNKIVASSFAGMTSADAPLNEEWDHTVAPGTTGSLNRCILPTGLNLGYWVLGAGQTILGPVGATDAIDIGCDQTDDEGLEVFSNWGPADGRPFSVGFDAAFYFLVKLNIQTINGCDDLFVGFKKFELVNADMEAYNTYAGIGLNTAASPGALKVRDELNGGGVINTDTTNTIASGTDLQIKVLVSAAGVTTFLIDAVTPGTLAAPIATHAFTFDDGDQLIPVVRFLNANAAQAGKILIKNWEVGYQ